ncbi:hypothetical protein RIVM261_036400 [Rivularia sp. IAM M-261]|nr:hypothetical protein CAL7716_075330 [Calothrix sp. PCC 7716]GJD18684.1 hypothetical protein RIVM261_036400 [Rivularia sp. IAM M-261]
MGDGNLSSYGGLGLNVGGSRGSVANNARGGRKAPVFELRRMFD